MYLRKKGKREFWEITFDRELTQEEQNEIYKKLNETTRIVRMTRFVLNLEGRTPPIYAMLKTIETHCENAINDSLVNSKPYQEILELIRDAGYE